MNLSISVATKIILRMQGCNQNTPPSLHPYKSRAAGSGYQIVLPAVAWLNNPGFGLFIVLTCGCLHKKEADFRKQTEVRFFLFRWFFMCTCESHSWYNGMVGYGYLWRDKVGCVIRSNRQGFTDYSDYSAGHGSQKIPLLQGRHCWRSEENSCKHFITIHTSASSSCIRFMLQNHPDMREVLPECRFATFYRFPQ